MAAVLVCVPINPRGEHEDASHVPCQPEIRIPRKVLKGGSHQYVPNYCRRYLAPTRNNTTILRSHIILWDGMLENVARRI